MGNEYCIHPVDRSHPSRYNVFSGDPVGFLFVQEPIGQPVGVEALVSNVPSDMQPLRPFFSFDTVVFLRVVERFEVDYYDAFPLVC